MRAIKQRLSEAEKRHEARAMRKRGCSFATICTTLKVRRNWLREVLGLPPIAPKQREAAPTFDGVPCLPSGLAILAAEVTRKLTKEEREQADAAIAAACDVLRKRQQESPPRAAPGDGKKFALTMAGTRGGTISL